MPSFSQTQMQTLANYIDSAKTLIASGDSLGAMTMIQDGSVALTFTRRI